MGACCSAPATTESGLPRPKRHRTSRRRKRAAKNAATQLQNGLHSSSEGQQEAVAHVHGPSSHALSDSGAHPRTPGHMDEDEYMSCGDEFMSCRDDFSVTDGSHLESFPVSPRMSGVLPVLNQSKVARTASATAAGDTALHTPAGAAGAEVQSADTAGSEEDSQESSSVYGSSEDDSELDAQQQQPANKFTGCLHILDIVNKGTTSGRHPQETRPLTSHASRRSSLPEAGCSMQPRDPAQPETECSYCWEDAGNSPFNIRSVDYMKTKIKIPSASAIYQLATADIFALPKKLFHIAKYLTLPPHGPPIMAGDVALPPLIIFNLQLPLYPAPIFGPYDGEGVSIVFYFRLPENFDPAKFENQKALELFKRFVTGGKEADGTPTRDRLKLIPRVVNVDEWVKKGPLSQAEHKLLITYNDKPILSRPQHEFHTGKGYLEVDLDLHQYTYLARRAIGTYLTKLPQVVWENAFVVQGNGPDELPEHLIGVSRIYRFDFKQAKPIPPARPGTSLDGVTEGEAAGQQTQGDRSVSGNGVAAHPARQSH